ncbi:MAG: 16S rRNA (guanine(527)-N(7))-methyltransferase RsmG [Thermoanaerobaculia bacterium]
MSLDSEEAPGPPEAFRRLLQDGARRFELTLPDSVLDLLAAYLSELDVWRRRVNLTGRLSPAELGLHALESAFGAQLIAHGARVVDVGSGAGFPGLPLAIARDDLAVTLVEPRAKRCAFLRHVVRTLGLKTVQVLEARIEQVGGQTFDVATTRAVGHFADWLAGTPFLDASGLVLAWATDTAGLETALGPKFRVDRAMSIPGSEKRRIVAFRRSA